ncbi:MAG: hypothetical protein AAF197_06850, partial [Pseudomonadota bacterium]
MNKFESTSSTLLNKTISRRQFGLALALGASSYGLTHSTSAKLNSNNDFEILDFHSHFIPEGIDLARPPKGRAPAAIERVF